MTGAAATSADSIWSWKIFVVCMMIYLLDGLMLGITFPASPFSDPITFIAFMAALITFAPLSGAPLFLQWIFTVLFGAYMVLSGMVLAVLVRGALP